MEAIPPILNGVLSIARSLDAEPPARRGKDSEFDLVLCSRLSPPVKRKLHDCDVANRCLPPFAFEWSCQHLSNEISINEGVVFAGDVCNNMDIPSLLGSAVTHKSRDLTTNSIPNTRT